MITLILLCRGGLGSGQLQQSKFESLGSLQFLLRKNCLKRMKLNEIDAGDGQFLNELFPFYFKSLRRFIDVFSSLATSRRDDLMQFLLNNIVNLFNGYYKNVHYALPRKHVVKKATACLVHETLLEKKPESSSNV